MCQAGWLERIADRTAQVMWVLGHEADLDADFLAIYRIDLEQVEISGPRYFALAHRLTAYHGVMAARAETERDQTQSHNTSTTTRTHSSPPPTTGGGENREVSLTAFRFMFPGMVSGGG